MLLKLHKEKYHNCKQEPTDVQNKVTLQIMPERVVDWASEKLSRQ